MIPMPAIVTQQISRRAVEMIKLTAPKRTGKAVNSIIPAGQMGIIAVEIPDNVAYLINLDEGSGAKPMINLTGKVIPIREPDGTIAFRKVATNSIGKIPIVSRASDNGQIYDGKPMWVKAAMPAQSFIYSSIDRSISEWEKTLKPDDLIKILQQTSLKDSINIILAGNTGGLIN